MNLLDYERLIILFFLCIIVFTFAIFPYICETIAYIKNRKKYYINKILDCEEELFSLVPGSKRYLKVSDKLNKYNHLLQQYNQVIGDTYEK